MCNLLPQTLSLHFILDMKQLPGKKKKIHLEIHSWCLFCVTYHQIRL